MAFFLTGTATTASTFTASVDVFLVPGAMRTVDGTSVAMSEPSGTTMTRLRIDGTVLCSNNTAIFLQSNGSGTDRLVIGASGEVHAFGGEGARMVGPNARLINDGQISGDTGAVIAGGVFSVVDNRGTLAGTANGGAGLSCIAGQSFVQVTNAGTISGFNGLTVTGSYVAVTNTGTIRATDAGGLAIDLTSAFAGCTIRNAGLISAPDMAIAGGSGDDLIVNSARILGDIALAAGDDTFAGARGSVDGTISGGIGNDSLSSGLNDDTVSGDTGNDTLRGNAGDDLLSGGTGIDRLRGGTGNDILTGGTDADTFLFSTGDGIDRITDFANGVDRLNLNELSIPTFAALTAEVANRAGGLLVDLRDFGGGTVFLTGMTKALFDAADIVL